MMILIASSSFGGGTLTAWKRRSSERSFSMDLRYSRRRGCADALDLATAESGLQDVGGVERSFGRTCADERVQLIDEDDGVLLLHQLFHDGLQTLFELAAILCARDDEREIEREDALVGEERRNFAVGDPLREAFDDGGLADAGLADQHGIVLGAAAENLDDALQLGSRPTSGSSWWSIAAWVRSRENSASKEDSRVAPLPAAAFLLRGALQLFADGRTGAGRARAGSPRRSTSLRAAGRAAGARCRCACATAARLLRRRRRARACTRWIAAGRPRSRPFRASSCGLRSACGWTQPMRASEESDW